MIEAGDADLPGRLAGLVAQLQGLLGRERIADDFVRFRIDLARAQSNIWNLQLAAQANPPNNTDTLDSRALILDTQLLKAYFADLCIAMERYGAASDDQKRLTQVLAGDQDRLAELVRLVGIDVELDYLDEVAGSLAVPSEILQFIAHTLASPFVALERQPQPPNVALPESPDGRCPFCGSGPALSKLRRADGKRSLYCALCGLEYFHRRVGCPYCACENQAELSLLYIGERDRQWIECCERCKQYIKVFDERKTGESWRMNPYLEESATLFLDLLAEREGHVRQLPFSPALT